jgi:outer membrane protein
MKIFSTILLCFSLIANVVAQENILTYEEAIKTALRENIPLQQEQNLLKVTEANRSQSYASFLPNVSAYLGANRIIGRQFDQTVGDFTSEKVNNLNGEIGANVPIFTGFNRLHTMKQAESVVEQQYYKISRSKQDAIFNASVQYLTVIVNRELLEVAQANLAFQEELLGSIQIFLETGTRNIADLYNQEAETKRVALTVVEAENQLAISKAELIRMLQVNPLVEWTFEAPEREFAELLTEEVNIESMYNEAIANRPDYKQQKEQIEIDERGVKIARSDYYPSLGIGYSLGSRFSSLAPDPFNEQFSNINRVQVYGAQLNIPIFSNLRTRATVQRSLQLYNNSQLALEDLERSIFTEVQTAIANFKAAQQRVIFADAQLKAAEKALEVEQERFRLGTGTLIDLNRANATHVQAQSESIQADYTLVFQKTALDYYKGVLETEIE